MVNACTAISPFDTPIQPYLYPHPFYFSGSRWLTYLQNRFNIPGSPSTKGTDLGLASTPDGGRTWIYRGVMLGLDVPASDRKEPLPPNSTTQQFGGATWWRPAVTTVDGVYHGFFSQWEQQHQWGLWKVVHYTSHDLKHWQFQQYVRNSTCPTHVSEHCITRTHGLPN